LVRVGVRLIQFGIAAIVLGFALKSLGMQADPADVGLRAERPGISVFGTIHPRIFQYRAPIGSQLAVSRAGVASLDAQAGFDAQRTPEDEPMPAWRNASFDERFASLGDPPASFGERFSLFDEHPAAFDESFAAATPEPTNSVRLPPDGNAQKAAPPMGRLPKAPPIPVAAKRHVRPEQSQKVSVSPPDDGGRTAIYDITAHVVYLPNGQRLEAHSGLSSFMDNPRHVHLRMSGATPPNVYRLSLREQLFHGVRAIRLTPVGSGKMYGRAGMLAHSYMLGPNGQSNGCVSFRNYPEFLNAYLKGEVTRLVVVEHLEDPPGPKVASGWLDAIKSLFQPSDRAGQYAAAD
jgi:Tlde1 domain